MVVTAAYEYEVASLVLHAWFILILKDYILDICIYIYTLYIYIWFPKTFDQQKSCHPVRCSFNTYSNTPDPLNSQKQEV